MDIPSDIFGGNIFFEIRGKKALKKSVNCINKHANFDFKYRISAVPVLNRYIGIGPRPIIIRFAHWACREFIRRCDHQEFHGG